MWMSHPTRRLVLDWLESEGIEPIIEEPVKLEERRPYLHDDWDAVHLEDAVVRQPSIVLWPHVLARVPLPADVEQVLVRPLVDEGGSEWTNEPWKHDVRPEGRCVRCQRQHPVLELAENLSLCADCLRQGADLLNGRSS